MPQRSTTPKQNAVLHRFIEIGAKYKVFKFARQGEHSEAPFDEITILGKGTPQFQETPYFIKASTRNGNRIVLCAEKIDSQYGFKWDADGTTDTPERMPAGRWLRTRPDLPDGYVYHQSYLIFRTN